MASRDQWTELCRAFGRAVRSEREGQGLSQEDLGFKADMDRTYISGIERGVRNPTLKIMGRIAKALGTTARNLLPG